MKRDSNELNISEIIRLFIKERGLEGEMLDSKAIEAWHKQMGEFMKKYTDRIFVRNRILHVQLNSPAIKNELQYGKSKIITHINQSLKEDYLLDVRFL